jgi:hypothetical protein
MRAVAVIITKKEHYCSSDHHLFCITHFVYCNQSFAKRQGTVGAIQQDFIHRYSNSIAATWGLWSEETMSGISEYGTFKSLLTKM